MLIPFCYYICIVFWMPRNWLEKVQYLLGLAIYILFGPFLNLFVYVYALYNMDSFGWGKTRKVVVMDSASDELQLDLDEVA